MASITRRPRDKERRRSRRTAHGRELLPVVERLLDEGHSYTTLSVQRLIKEAGISRATFYSTFDDKYDLLAELATDIFALLVEASRKWWELPPQATRADLLEALRYIFDMYAPHRRIIAAVIEACGYDPQMRNTYQATIQHSVDAVTEHILVGQREGFVHQELNAVHAAECLTWTCERGMYRLRDAVGTPQLEDHVAALADLVWNGLYARTRQPDDAIRSAALKGR